MKTPHHSSAGFFGLRDRHVRMGSFSTESLIRWVIQWDRVLDQAYGTAAMWWELVAAKNAAITELLRRGVCSTRWGYLPPWGHRVVPR